ncbi:MAG: type II secretion system secretin GspD [Pseudomonadota bacterium]
MLKPFRAAFVLMLMAVPLPIAAQPLVTLNYENANLSLVASEVAERTGFQLVLDPSLQGRANIISPPGMGLTPQQVWEVFLATLQVNKFTAVPAGDGVYKIIPIEQGARDSAPLEGSSGRTSTVTRIIAFEHIDVRAAASALRGLVSQQGLLIPISESNAVVVVDSERNIDRVQDVVRRIDVDSTIVRTFLLDNASAESVATTLRAIVGERTGGDVNSRKLDVIDDQVTNQIILRGTPEQIQAVVPIIRQLDQTGRLRGNFDTIYLNHADGEQLIPIINTLLGGGNEGAGATPATTTAKPTISFHKPTNAILVNAPLETQKTIRQLVARLDVQRPQVMIEALVVEINNNTARELGVQYLTGGDNIPITAATFTDTQPNLLSAAGAAFFLTEDDGVRESTETTDTGTVIVTQVDDVDADVAALSGQLVQAAVSDLLSFNGFLSGFGGITDDGDVWGVLVSAIKSDGRSNVLSTPHVTVLDNETATLQVGQEIPIVTGEAVGSDFQGGFRNIEREDIGNILEVTPQINEGDSVLLKIRLEVSSIGAFTTASDSIITNKSVVETVAVAGDGQTLIIGGLVDNDRRRTESKVPILGDIPLLGFFFRGSESSEEETTLMAFIRPTIIRDRDSADLVTAKKYQFVEDRQIRADGNRQGPSRLELLQQELLGAADSLPEEGPVNIDGEPGPDDE